MQGGRFVSTYNANLKTEITSVSSEISGRVIEVIPHDNDRVQKGQLLFRLDDAPYRISLTKAQANLAGVKSTIEAEIAGYQSDLLAIENAQTDVEYRLKEMERIGKLVATRSVPEAQFDQAQYAWRSAVNALDNRRQELLTSKASLIDPALPPEQHPRYLQALAELEKVTLDISHLEVVAPVDGVAVNVSVHEGEYVIAGSELVSVVDDRNLWLEANFKETDLTYVRTGQSVDVTIDAFPGQTFTATVKGITPATGSEFSLLPAQNSSGNWIKVVQRIQVNIALEDIDHNLPIAAGMSAEVDIDTGRSRTLPWVAAK
jgi:membrane fusion protein (multidrug efflux system)